jgi:hypothetical protein
MCQQQTGGVRGRPKRLKLAVLAWTLPPPPTQLSDTRKKDKKSVECPLIQNLLFAPLF